MYGTGWIVQFCMLHMYQVHTQVGLVGFIQTPLNSEWHESQNPTVLKPFAINDLVKAHATLQSKEVISFEWTFSNRVNMQDVSTPKALMKVKACLPDERKRCVAYEVHCKGCDKRYIGETRRTLKIRLGATNRPWREETPRMASQSMPMNPNCNMPSTGKEPEWRDV